MWFLKPYAEISVLSPKCENLPYVLLLLRTQNRHSGVALLRLRPGTILFLKRTSHIQAQILTKKKVSISHGRGRTRSTSLRPVYAALYQL